MVVEEKNSYVIYQLNQGIEYDTLRNVPYKELRPRHLRVSIDNYHIVYNSPMPTRYTAYTIFHRLNHEIPQEMTGHPLETSDVIVINKNGDISAFYVDGHSLVLLPWFNRPSGESKMIELDAEDYVISGKEGTWSVCEEIIVRGIPFYIMRNEQDINAMYVLLSFDGKVVADNFNELTSTVKEEIMNHLKTWREYYVQGNFQNVTEEQIAKDEEIRHERENVISREQMENMRRERAEQRENIVDNSQEIRDREWRKRKNDEKNRREMPQYQKYYENGMYERIDPSIDVNEGGYDFIDGRNGNNPDITKDPAQSILSTPRVYDGKESVIDKLYIFKANIALEDQMEEELDEDEQEQDNDTVSVHNNNNNNDDEDDYDYYGDYDDEEDGYFDDSNYN